MHDARDLDSPPEKKAPAAGTEPTTGEIKQSEDARTQAASQGSAFVVREWSGARRGWRYFRDFRKLADLADRNLGTFPAPHSDLWTVLFTSASQVLLFDLGTTSIGAIHQPTAREIEDAAKARTSPYSREDGWPEADDVFMFFEEPARVRLLWSPMESGPRMTGGAS